MKKHISLINSSVSVLMIDHFLKQEKEKILQVNEFDIDILYTHTHYRIVKSSLQVTYMKKKKSFSTRSISYNISVLECECLFISKNIFSIYNSS